jgi:hypothetical protein
MAHHGRSIFPRKEELYQIFKHGGPPPRVLRKKRNLKTEKTGKTGKALVEKKRKALIRKGKGERGGKMKGKRGGKAKRKRQRKVKAGGKGKGKRKRKGGRKAGGKSKLKRGHRLREGSAKWKQRKQDCESGNNANPKGQGTWEKGPKQRWHCKHPNTGADTGSQGSFIQSATLAKMEAGRKAKGKRKGKIRAGGKALTTKGKRKRNQPHHKKHCEPGRVNEKGQHCKRRCPAGPGECDHNHKLNKEHHRIQELKQNKTASQGSFIQTATLGRMRRQVRVINKARGALRALRIAVEKQEKQDGRNATTPLSMTSQPEFSVRSVTQWPSLDRGNSTQSTSFIQTNQASTVDSNGRKGDSNACHDEK